MGRGLDSLFEDSANHTQTAAEKEGVVTLRMADIEPDKDQPRKEFDQTALNELSASITEHGVLQPIVVRARGVDKYVIVAGERRWRASRMAGLMEIPAIVKQLTDAQAMEITMIENLQREDLDPVEEAMGYKALMDRCGYTQEKAAQKLSKSRSAVANSLRLLNLPEEVLQSLQKGKISVGHAKVILSLPTAALQAQAAKAVAAQGLNVRETEALCKKLTKRPKTPQPKNRPALPDEVELSLREALGTEIKVAYKDGRGSLQVSFYSDEQLKAFANLLGKYQKEKNK